MDSIYTLTSLDNFKSYLNKSNTTNDEVLRSIIVSASNFIESYTKRKIRARQYGTGGLDPDYYNGNGKSLLYTNQFPIISVESLYDDPDRNFTSTTLKASTEYIIWKEEGIIELYSDAINGSIFSHDQSNVKLSYTAGYGTFEIITNKNDSIHFTDDSGSYKAKIDSGVYTADGLATEIQTQMNASASDTITVYYDDQTNKFVISSDGSTFTLNWTNSAIVSKNIGKTIGFDVTSDDSGDTSYTADKSVLGLPNDIELACILISMRILNQTGIGADRFDKISQSIAIEKGGGTLRYSESDMPLGVKLILDKYKRINV